ncbi:hypothetical protein GCM10017083_49590 [Thalassobaculum fulvum]|uniref:Lipoprotein n=1 Tax=Thalassobaculum fulvum TaxID=1633335 RepID=A0A918XXQ5_9PROT|nr:hypothetical protein [Thalassobaculum fulvum]GHD61774.1 hypothetical protein GCM10017083_49590 [Thalassobaculum fulvum]
MAERTALLARVGRSAGVSALAVAMLAGCAEVQNAVNDVSNAFQPKQEEPALPPPTSYCYRTLGKVNCYSQPLPGDQSNRLIGYQGPPPRSTSGTGPLSP